MTDLTPDVKKIRLMIVDDHQVVRKGISMMLATEEDMDLVGEGCNGMDAVELVRTLQPDVIVMDLVMPVMDGASAIKKIIEENPKARILVLSSFSEDQKVISALKAGASGYLLKDSSPNELLEGIREVYRGKSSLSPVVASKLINEIQTESSPLVPGSQNPLSEREIDVIRLIAEGLSNKEIAEKLCLSKTTVRFHIRNVFSKLGFTNRTQAGLYAIKNGMVEKKKKF